MFTDSHCHLDFPELSANLAEILNEMELNRVTRALCISVNLLNFPRVLRLAETHAHLYATVGVHPDETDEAETDPESLVKLAQHPRVLAIGETGLDYFRLGGDLAWQRQRFRNHIRAARTICKPLIIHCREAAHDLLAIMREERAADVGGIMHCFTEDWATAQAALDLGFHISFSGIVTFKNAKQVKDVAARVPADRYLIETDSPYLAPVPNRGKINRPGWVVHVAEQLAQIRHLSIETVATETTSSFLHLFSLIENDTEK